MNQDQQQRVQERAHQIWEEEGRPEGQGDRHWQQAEREINGGDDSIDPDDLAYTSGRGDEGLTDDARSARGGRQRLGSKQPG